jgi:hypothetical protein
MIPLQRCESPGAHPLPSVHRPRRRRSNPRDIPSREGSPCRARRGSMRPKDSANIAVKHLEQVGEWRQLSVTISWGGEGRSMQRDSIRSTAQEIQWGALLLRETLQISRRSRIAAPAARVPREPPRSFVVSPASIDAVTAFSTASASAGNPRNSSIMAAVRMAPIGLA